MSAAAAQAELMEREKHVMDIQRRLQSLKGQLQSMANHQVALEREKRRSQLTRSEVEKLESTHVVYKGLGRAFMSVAVPEMAAENAEVEAKCTQEVQRVVEEKKKIGAVIQNEEEQLNVAAKDFIAAVRLLQASNQLPASS